MTYFTLSQENTINGDQLAEEILQATGLDVSERYTFYPPSTVQIIGNDVDALQEEIQAVVSTHVPTPPPPKHYLVIISGSKRTITEI